MFRFLTGSKEYVGLEKDLFKDPENSGLLTSSVWHYEIIDAIGSLINTPSASLALEMLFGCPQLARLRLSQGQEKNFYTPLSSRVESYSKEYI